MQGDVEMKFKSSAVVVALVTVLSSCAFVGISAISSSVVGASSPRVTETSTQTVTDTTPGQTVYTIPADTISLSVTAVASGGATSSAGGAPPGTPGQGAAVSATISPAGLSQLFLEVGTPGNASPAYGGGGNSTYSATGGGASDVQACSASASGCTHTANPSSDPRLIVAGGGGGAGEDSFSDPIYGGGTGGSAGDCYGETGSGSGGAGTDSQGSGTSGNPGANACNGTAVGAGGAGSALCGGGNGGSGAAGSGGSGQSAQSIGADSDGGGGGGGWVGGSGGGEGGCPNYSDSGTGGGGGAGTSFVESTATSVSILESSAAPEISITALIGVAPQFTSASSTAFTIGAQDSFNVTAPASPTSRLSDGSATLPNGINFVDNGNGTATLVGDPAAGTKGAYNIEIIASNGTYTGGVEQNTSQSFTLTVDQEQAPLIITSTSGPSGTPIQLAATGGSVGGTPQYTVDSAGTAGCTLTGTQLNSTSAGTCTVTASLPGGSFYLPVSSAPTVITFTAVAQAPLIITSRHGTFGTVLALKSRGGTDNGAVTYAVDDRGPAGCSISGSSLMASSAGACTVTATMAGTVNYNPVSSQATTITIGPDLTRTRLTLSRSTIIFGREQMERISVMVTATGAVPTGIVSVRGTRCHITLLHGAGSCSLTKTELSVGSHGLVAAFTGSARFSSSSSKEYRLVVKAAT